MAALTPWPDNPSAALETLRQHLDVVNPAADVNSALSLLAASASALVERYAPGAPQAVRDTALVRTVQYLLERSGAGPTAAMQELGDWKASEEFTASPSPLRGSGAMAILSPWKVRRARIVEDTT